MQLIYYPLFFILLTSFVARCLTPQEEAFQRTLDGPNFHADLPFLGESHKRRWYLYLVIAFVGLAFLTSLTVVIFGFVKWRRRRKVLSKLAKETGDEEKLAKRIDVYGGVHRKELKAPVKLDLLAFKPSKEEDLRVRALYMDNEVALQKERMRRTAQHEKPLQTLHTLRRLNSS